MNINEARHIAEHQADEKKRYDHDCPDSPNGHHQVDLGAKAALVDHDESSWMLDVWCKHCGQSGGILINRDTRVSW